MGKDHFFVTIIASNQEDIRQLGKYGLDLFQQTSAVTEKTQVHMRSIRDQVGIATYEKTDRMTEAQEFSIQGLLTLAEIGQLVEDGYSVLVRESAMKRSPVQTGGIDFQTWLKGMEAE
ncbi:MAG TPA: hypothetical protein V6C65_16500 [Allocoleopsis sp.]